MSAVRSVERQRKEDVEDNEGYADEYGEDEIYDVESLHADSFVTATTNSNEGFEHERADEAKDDHEDGLNLAELRKGKGVAAATTTAATGSVHSKRSGLPLPVTSIIQSGSSGSAGSGSATTATGEPFIARRWERDAALGLSFSRNTRHSFWFASLK
ncbi:hypothetical protein B0H34DRAFT_399833 [Crassisporium funariophilum]|nr:hypothetical protein B0H34DRAFT_399833 [Crassisporium funariophilum]